MSLEALQKEIEKKGKDEARNLESLARNEASLVIDEAKKHAKRIDSETREAIKQEVKRLQNEYAANSELARNTIVVGARDAVVDEVFERMRKNLADDLREKQKKIFDNAAKIAKDLGPIEKMRYVINKKDAELVKSWKGKVEFGNLIGGVVIYSEDAKVKIDASIDTMLDNNAQNIKSIISDSIYHVRKSGGNVKSATPKAGSKKHGKSHARKRSGKTVKMMPKKKVSKPKKAKKTMKARTKKR